MSFIIDNLPDKSYLGFMIQDIKEIIKWTESQIKVLQADLDNRQNRGR